MTDKADNSHVEIEQLLKSVRPAEPSDHLKEQVVAAAHQAWQERFTLQRYQEQMIELMERATRASCAPRLSITG